MPKMPEKRAAADPTNITPDLLPLAVDIDLPTYDPENARLHPEENRDAIRASLMRYGQRKPIVVNRRTGHVEAGNGTLEAARSLGWHRIAAVWVDDDHVTAAGYGLADNRTAELAEWNAEVVRRLDSLVREADGCSIGWTTDDIRRLRMVVKDGNTDPDAIPDPPKVPITKLGDVWILGQHRLLCGDSTNKDNVQKLLAGEIPNLCVTDPPYGVDYDPDWRNQANDWLGCNVKIGGRAVGIVNNDDQCDWKSAFVLHPGNVIYAWHGALKTSETQAALESAEFITRGQMIWVKSSIVVSRGAYHWQHEPCWYAVRKGKSADWIGDRKQSTVWSIQKNKASETGHSTQKPVECMRKPISNHSGDVYDPFVGSGTTIIACEQLGRRCYAMELDPIYVDVAVKRYVEFVGDTSKVHLVRGTKRVPYEKV